MKKNENGIKLGNKHNKNEC